MRTFFSLNLFLLFSILNFINLNLAILPNAKITLFVTTDDPISVQQLVVGRLQLLEEGSSLTSSVTLIQDNGYYMVVDSPSATDVTGKEQMLRGLNNARIYPGIVQMVVNTHGHPDHFGQGNFFPNARHFFASYEYTGTNYIKTELYSVDVMKVTKNIELWNTPGHTNQDISAVVRNVPCCGTVAVVGDLFYTESDAVRNTTDQWRDDAWNAEVGMRYRTRVICEADWIVPGHGRIFQVTETMKKLYNCTTDASTAATTASTTPPSTSPSTVPTTISPIFVDLSHLSQGDVDFSTSSSFVDLDNNLENPFHDDMTIVPSTEPTPTPIPQSYITVDHWQNRQNQDISEKSQVPVATGPVANGLYAVRAGTPVAQIPLSNQITYFAAPPPAVQEPQTRVIHHLPVYPVRSTHIHPPGAVILPMVESAAANLVSYLNSPQVQQHFQPVTRSVPGYFEIIKRAFRKFTNNEPVSSVIQNSKN